MRIAGFITAATRERVIPIYLADLDGVAVTGLTGSDLTIALWYQAEGTSGYVDVSVLGATVAELDAGDQPGWYTIRTTPYGAGETLVTVTPTFTNNSGPQGFHVDSRGVVGAEPSAYLVLEHDDATYLVPAYLGADL